MITDTSAFLSSLAASLPGTWHYSTVGNMAQLIRTSDKLAFSVAAGGYGNKGKIHFVYSSYSYNPDRYVVTVYDEKHERVPYPSINVSEDKDVVTIAKDIERRLLPDAEKVHALVIKQVTEEKNFEEGKTNTIYNLANLLGVQPDRHYQTHELNGKVVPYTKEAPSFGEHGYGEFVVNGENSISLKLESMSFKTASALAVAFKQILLDDK